MDGRTVLVLGGYGETGRRLARFLLERTDAEVVVAGRDVRRAAALAAELGARRVRGIGLDAADALSVRRALEGVDLLVNAAVVPRQVAALARTAIAAETDWLDFPDSPRPGAGARRAGGRDRRRGTLLRHAGRLPPGLPAALVRWAALRVDELRGAWIASVLAERGGILATSGLDELVASFRDYRAMRYENGRWQEVPVRAHPTTPSWTSGSGSVAGGRL